MRTTLTPPSPGIASYPRRSPASDPQGRAERSGRGHLVMDRQVVEKIAAQAASEVAAAGGRSGGLFGIGAHTDLWAKPKVDVELSGRSASIDLEVAVAYPASIVQSTDRVRRRVVDTVQSLTGVQVTRLDITVVALHRTNTGTDTNDDNRTRELL